MPKELWTVEQTANYLGIKVNSIYARIQRGQLPYIKLGHNILRFDPEEIEKLVEAGRQKAFALEESK